MSQTCPSQQLDPRTLLIDVQVRAAAQPEQALVASGRDAPVLVLVPVQALRDADGGIRVRYGHRCILAAIEAGRATIPVLVSDAEDDQGARIIAQLTDNHHRALLPARDQISSIGQLYLFGMSAAQIARRTNSARKDVDSAILAAASKLAVEATRRYEFLTLDQAGALAEFDDDRRAVSSLVVTAQRNPEQFKEVLSWQRGRPARVDRALAKGDRTGSVPVLAAKAKPDQAASIICPLVDDHDRASLPVADQINLVGQLRRLGMSAAQIARRTNSARDDVESAICVASSKLATEAVDRYEFLTLDQAAAVALAHDKLAVSTLIVTARRNPEQFDEVLDRQRERAARLDRARANRHQVDRVKVVPASADSAPDMQTAAYVENHYNNESSAVAGRPLYGGTKGGAKQPSDPTKTTRVSSEPQPICCDHDSTAERRQAEDVFAGRVVRQCGDQAEALAREGCGGSADDTWDHVVNAGGQTSATVIEAAQPQ
jgi:hypothetical protein